MTFKSAPSSQIKRFLIFILCSSLDVRVKANSLQEPKQCLNGNGVCALLADSAIETLSLGSNEAKFVRGSSLVQVSRDTVKLIRGTFKIKASGKMKIDTLYGELWLTDGEVLLEAKDSLVKFTNLSSDLKYKPRGEKDFHALPVAFSTYMAAITRSGVADTGFPHPAEIDNLIRDWSRVYLRREKSKFTSDLREFMRSWSSATQLVGSWYMGTVSREIASEEAEAERQARLKAAREAENKLYRDMFREKIFSPY